MALEQRIEAFKLVNQALDFQEVVVMGEVVDRSQDEMIDDLVEVAATIIYWIERLMVTEDE